MRPRPVKGAAAKIAAHPKQIVSIARNESLSLIERLPGSGPLHLELGAGKGTFIQTMGQRHPDFRFMAVEKFDHAIVKLLDKLLETELSNVLAVRMDAEQLVDCLPPKSVACIYLNFSDPWPKARHAKRRLTQPNFLALYARLLTADGSVVFKTDNRKFFEESTCLFSENGWSLSAISLDLHADQDPDNVLTEFEARFSQYGPIYRLIAKPKEDHS